MAVPPRNRLLVALAATEPAILAECSHRELPMGALVHEQDERVSEVIFPESGVVSMLTVMDDGMAVEAAMVGREGIVGFPVAANGAMPWRAVVQVPGEGLSLPLETFRRHVADSTVLRSLLEGYSSTLLALSAQSIACNRFHELSERLARWLLMTHDRAEADGFPTTHEFLGQMLGAHRPSVTLAARQLQQAGLIEYGRGRVRIREREGLEAVACECYERIRRRHEALFAEG